MAVDARNIFRFDGDVVLKLDCYPIELDQDELPLASNVANHVDACRFDEPVAGTASFLVPLLLAS